MAKSKLICVKLHYRAFTFLYCGTLQALIREVFGYTLKCGHKLKPSISISPRGLKSLVDSLNKSFAICNSRGSNWAEESTYKEFIAAGGVIEEGEEYGSITIK